MGIDGGKEKAKGAWSRLNLSIEGPTERQQECSQLADSIFEMTIKMFFKDNYIHGDLHAGNVMYSEKEKRLTVIDAGIVAAFGDERIKDFRSFLRYICKRDTARIADK